MKSFAHILFGIVLFLIHLDYKQVAFAEEEQNQTPTNEEFEDPHQQMLAALQDKLTTADGTPVNIALIPPLDYSGGNLGDMVGTGLINSLAAFGVSNTEIVDYKIASLTSEDLQFAAYQLQSDIVIVTILTEYQFELFIYDNAEPNKIYMSSQPVPDPRVKQYTSQAVQYYTDMLISRTLSLYANGYFYELPNKKQLATGEAVEVTELPKFARAISEAELELPRSVASLEEEMEPPLHRVNMYFTPGLGVISAKGADGVSWSYYLMSLHFGYRLSDRIFGEIGLDHFSYHAAILGGRYYFGDQNKSGFSAGLGLAKIIERYEYEGKTKGQPVDPEPFRQQAGIYLVPSVGLHVLFWDTRFKLEVKAFVGSGGRSIFVLLPGIITSF